MFLTGMKKFEKQQNMIFGHIGVYWVRSWQKLTSRLAWRTFAHASFSELEDNAFSLSIPLYVKPANDENADDRSIEETVESWRAASTEAASLLDNIAAKLHENDGE